jgi:hypothetical protein
MPLGPLLRNGYLLKGKTLAELAGKAGIDAQGLQQTVREYNLGAVQGEDRQFGRGSTSFNRYLADPQQQPNPCVAPVGEGPYFAVKVIMGDLGTFDGLRTSVVGEVLAADGQAIDGLYAVGNDRASIMGGNYPGAGITLGPIMTFGYITGRHLAGVEQGWRLRAKRGRWRDGQACSRPPHLHHSPALHGGLSRSLRPVGDADPAAPPRRTPGVLHQQHRPVEPGGALVGL